MSKPDHTYKICSTIIKKNSETLNNFFIQELRRFGKWETIHSYYEKFTNDKLENVNFTSYEETEQYLLEKYLRGDYVERDGNIYKVWIPVFYC